MRDNRAMQLQKNLKNLNGGYIGLAMLLIVVAIMAYIFIKYQSPLIQRSPMEGESPTGEQSVNTPEGQESGWNNTVVSPIDKANKAKMQLEGNE